MLEHGLNLKKRLNMAKSKPTKQKNKVMPGKPPKKSRRDSKKK